MGKLQVPMDVVKERLQIEGQMVVSTRLNGSLKCASYIWQTEGVRGFYRAYWLHQMTWAPFNGLYFASYGFLKFYFTKYSPPGAEIVGQFLCGMVSAAFASLVTSPFDMIKTRLQVQRSNPEIFDYAVRSTPLWFD